MNRRKRVTKLPTLRLTLAEFGKLSEYSCSVPTGTTPGKRWKRHVGAHDRDCPVEERYWIIGEYGTVTADGKNIAINWYHPIITIRAGIRDSCQHNWVHVGNQHYAWYECSVCGEVS